METPQPKSRFHIGMRNIKTALSACICAFIYQLIDRNPTFACIGAIFGMGNDMDNSKLNGGNRLFGTLFGGLIGMAIFAVYIQFYPDGKMRPLILPFLFVGVILLIKVSLLMHWPGAIQPGGVILCIILFNTPVDTFVPYSINRIIDTGIGVAIALGVNYIFPKERWQKWKQTVLPNKTDPGDAPDFSIDMDKTNF